MTPENWLPTSLTVLGSDTANVAAAALLRHCCSTGEGERDEMIVKMTRARRVGNGGDDLRKEKEEMSSRKEEMGERKVTRK